MPSFSLQLQLTPGTSQVTPSAPLLIAGTTMTREDWDQYFPDLPGLSTVSDDRPTRDMDSGRRLSYGSSSRDAGDLSQAQRPLCAILTWLRLMIIFRSPTRPWLLLDRRPLLPSLPVLLTIMLQRILQ
nr:uncharacterized protein LOC104093426 [Nicotiana tomentosiformis]XP_033511312.1 uncharacterized protein LOC104093426 [Nicotiana tomentosiformis]